MKKLFLVANWKSNKTVNEAHSFMISFLNHDFITWMHSQNTDVNSSKQIVICPSFTLLAELDKLIKQNAPSFSLSLGAQNISPFDKGPYTGEESATQIAEFAKYVILGHSERRLNFGETDQQVEEKAAIARKYQLEPIVCVQGKETPVPPNVHIVAYEPLDAISTGRVGEPAKPERAEEVAHFFRHEKHIPYVLYGGSVDPSNVRQYTSLESINGVLIGGASLDPVSFSQIIQNA